MIERWLQYDPREDRFDFVNPITNQAVPWYAVPLPQLVFRIQTELMFRIMYPFYRLWCKTRGRR